MCLSFYLDISRSFLKVSDIAASLWAGRLRICATGGRGRLTGGNPGRGGPRGPGLPGAVGPLLPPLSFLNLVFILNKNSFSFSRLIHPIAPSTIIIRIISTHTHHDEPSSSTSVVFVRQQTPSPSQE